MNFSSDLSPFRVYPQHLAIPTSLFVIILVDSEANESSYLYSLSYQEDLRLDQGLHLLVECLILRSFLSLSIKDGKAGHWLNETLHLRRTPKVLPQCFTVDKRSHITACRVHPQIKPIDTLMPSHDICSPKLFL